MEVKRLKLICFSPTGTTRKVLESVAKGIGAEDVACVDLTLPGRSKQAIDPFSDELVLIGAPVYGGRLPLDAIHRFRRLKATNTPAILIVVYGNREFEDALLELKNLAIELGFNPVAGGAFIGEHSFATPELAIANGRPDSLDVQKAMGFGEEIKNRIKALPSPDAGIPVNIPGRFPYEGGARSMAVSPVTVDGKCTVCGACEGVCPTAAISVGEAVETSIERCIRCCACIKHCPTGARVWEDDTMKSIANWLHEHCSIRKEPQIFW